MKSGRDTTTDAVEILRRRYFNGDRDFETDIEAARASAEIARRIYDLRTEAGLTQQALAKLVGTSASVISRLEDDDYEGHSLTMLRRIAAALHQRVEVRFVPI
ncbi:MAG TPA: XRE family transcriptional regulator [Armatimonadota bacterium]|jgi:DNA-binding XRE family transcriptional regulator